MSKRVRGSLLWWLVPEEKAADGIYGLILVGALMAAEGSKRESHLEAVGSVLIALLIYWAAHAYSDALGEHVKGEALTFRVFTQGVRHGWPIVRGITLPMLALLLSWLAGASTQTALSAAVWTTVGELIVVELLVGLRAKAGTLELLLDCCVGAGIGGAILALRALLH